MSDFASWGAWLRPGVVRADPVAPPPGRPGPAMPMHAGLLAPRRPNDIERDAIEQFERRNPDLEVIVGNAAIRNATDDPQRFLTGVAGGVPPDVIYFDRYAVAEWASRGAFEPLDKYLAADRQELQQTEAAAPAGPPGRRSGPGRGPLRDQLARLQENLSTRRISTRPPGTRPTTIATATAHPQLYGVPAGADDRALYYNEAASSRTGFVDDDGHARPPRTWEEILTKIADGSTAELIPDPRGTAKQPRLTSAGVDFAQTGRQAERPRQPLDRQDDHGRPSVRGHLAPRTERPRQGPRVLPDRDPRRPAQDLQGRRLPGQTQPLGPRGPALADRPGPRVLPRGQLLALHVRLAERRPVHEPGRPDLHAQRPADRPGPASGSPTATTPWAATRPSRPWRPATRAAGSTRS